MRVIHWKAVPAALGFFASVVAMGALFAFGSLQADAVGLMPVSTPLFVYGIIVVAGRLLLPRVLDRFRPLLLGVLGVAVWALIGVAFGLLVRQQVVAVVVLVLVVFLLDPLLVLALSAVGEVGGVDQAGGDDLVALDGLAEPIDHDRMELGVARLEGGEITQGLGGEVPEMGGVAVGRGRAGEGFAELGGVEIELVAGHHAFSRDRTQPSKTLRSWSRAMRFISSDSTPSKR